MNGLIDRISRLGESMRQSFEALSDRERRLVVVLLVVFGLFVTVLPVYLMGASVADLEADNEGLREVIRDFHRNEDKLRTVAAERSQNKARYAQKPPQLSSFVAEKAKRFGIEVREFSDQPDKKELVFTRHRLRVKIADGIGLKPVMKFLEAIENSPYPIAVERVHIEHYQPGDNYNGIEVDVISFERNIVKAS